MKCVQPTKFVQHARYKKQINTNLRSHIFKNYTVDTYSLRHVLIILLIILSPMFISLVFLSIISSTTRNSRFSYGFACEKYSAGIPEDFAALYLFQTKFPAVPKILRKQLPTKVLAGNLNP